MQTDVAVDLLEKPHPAVGSRSVGSGVDPARFGVQLRQQTVQIAAHARVAAAVFQIEFHHPGEQPVGDRRHFHAAMVKRFRVEHPFQLESHHQPEKIALVHHIVVILKRIDQRRIIRRNRERQVIHADQPFPLQRRRQHEASVKQFEPVAAAGIDLHLGATALDQDAARLSRQAVRRRELHRRAGLQQLRQFPDSVFL